jgi:PAS domain S-box-containing protein
MLTLENVAQYGQDGMLLHLDKRPYRAMEYPLARALRNGEVINQEEMLYRRPDGEVIVLLVNAAPIRRSDGQIIAAVMTYEDISERKKAEETQALLASIVESSAESIVGKTLEGTIFSWNKGAERIYGYPASKAVGKSISLIFPPERADEQVSIMERIRRGESLTDFETVRKTADGRIIHVSLTVSPIRDVTGMIIGASAITRDITERVMAEQHRAELLRLEQAARKSAEEANQLKDEFLAMISHELRTPLTSIMGFASTLLSEDITWDAESQQQFIEIINEEAEKLKELVENLLDISRLQARTLRIHAEPRPLDEIIENARPQLEVITSQHRLVYDIPDTLPPVMADERRIAQVISNLVDNAVKYSPSGTEIRITAERVEKAVQVNVSDQGPGIPTEARDLVFEAFRQAASHTDSGQGAGLGLAICKGLVEAHGGKIWLNDRDGHGTTVSFTLPIAPADKIKAS